MNLSRSRFTAAWWRSIGLMLGLCVAATASPSNAQRNRDDCGMQLRRICCSPPTPSVLLLSCAAKQRIPLDLGPGRFEIFVDGELVSGSPRKLALRADKTHVVFVKRVGHIPEMIVLRTDSQSGPCPKYFDDLQLAAAEKIPLKCPIPCHAPRLP